ncbi:MAG: 16S rRNA (guanine(527)-N(7))-methyltransferase RsmG [Comamonas sp.]|nr:16S rRNA (guanine(527)-N(7))-methyltransferase RsmG [Comamonas sp.]
MNGVNGVNAAGLDDLRPGLQAGLAQLGLLLNAGQEQQLLDFLALLHKWNKVYNLTAVRNLQEMLTHHLLDSLAAVPALQKYLQQHPTAQRLLDVGAGGGLPGVVFAICCPDLQVHCVDTVAKKAAFIQQAAASLGLGNLRGIHARVESLTGQDYAVISCRAFASLVDFTQWSQAALAPDGVWLALKGKHPEEEIAALAQQQPVLAQVLATDTVTVPFLQAQRCLVWMQAAAQSI